MPLVNGKFEPLKMAPKHAAVIFARTTGWSFKKHTRTLPYLARFPKRKLFKYRYRVLHGGRSGGKDWAFAEALIEIAIRKPIRVLGTREVQKKIKGSVKILLEDTIKRLGYSQYFTVLNESITGINGTIFTFDGLNDMSVEQLKSLEGTDYVLIGEAESLTEKSFLILDPTIRKPGSEIWVQFNPKLKTDFVVKKFIENPPINAIVGQVNYPDNPWCPIETLIQAETMKKENYPLYLHIWMGECSSKGKFFYNFGKHLCIEPFQIPPGSRLFGSLDHGTTAPTSFGLWYNDHNKRPIRVLTYYQPEKTASENAYAIAYLIQSFPLTGGQPPAIVYADPSMWTKVRLESDFQPAAIDYYNAAFKDVFKNSEVKTQFVKGNNDIRNGCAIMREMFSTVDGVPNSFYFDKYNKAYEELIPIQEADKYDCEIYDTKLEDHIADDTRYFACGNRGVVKGTEKKPEPDYNQQLALMNRKGMIAETGI